MKSGKQRRLEIKAKRQEKARKVLNVIPDLRVPLHAIEANDDALAHNRTYGSFLLYYVDIDFRCVECDAKETWLATQQKWWYEVIKGCIYSRAKHCRKCRKAIRDKKVEQQIHMKSRAKVPPHPHEAFFKKRYR